MRAYNEWRQIAPCPFCGRILRGRNVVTGEDGKEAFVRCDNSECKADGPAINIADAAMRMAVKAWHKRAKRKPKP